MNSNNMENEKINNNAGKILNYNPLKDANFWVAFVLGGGVAMFTLVAKGIFVSSMIPISIFLLTWEAVIIFQKGKKWSLVYGFILAIIITIPLVFFMAQFNDPMGGANKIAGQLPDMTQPSVSGWETYRSETYGLEVKYPAGWSVGQQKLATGIEIESAGKGDAPGHIFSINYSETLQKIKPNYSSLNDYMANTSFKNGKMIKFKGDDAFSGTLELTGINASETFIIIQHDGHIYSINYINESSYAEIDKQISDTLTFFPATKTLQ